MTTNRTLSRRESDLLAHIDAQEAVIANLRAGLVGLTCFVRCATCGELWVAQSCINFGTGKQSVLWTRPRATRNAHNIYSDYRGPCKHQGGIEQWNGTAWVVAPVSKAVHVP